MEVLVSRSKVSSVLAAYKLLQRRNICWVKGGNFVLFYLLFCLFHSIFVYSFGEGAYLLDLLGCRVKRGGIDGGK